MEFGVSLDLDYASVDSSFVHRVDMELFALKVSVKDLRVISKRQLMQLENGRLFPRDITRQDLRSILHSHFQLLPMTTHLKHRLLQLGHYLHRIIENSLIPRILLLWRLHFKTNRFHPIFIHFLHHFFIHHSLRFLHFCHQKLLVNYSDLRNT